MKKGMAKVCNFIIEMGFDLKNPIEMFEFVHNQKRLPFGRKIRIVLFD